MREVLSLVRRINMSGIQITDRCGRAEHQERPVGGHPDRVVFRAVAVLDCFALASESYSRWLERMLRDERLSDSGDYSTQEIC